ncbi:MAG: alpha/beta hydrolase [Clostridia bacterium]|nr:alpha/beta hydrolase [Clostridia bacterium]
MASKTFKKTVKTAAITAAAVGGASFLLSEFAFEFALTSRGMKRRLNTITLEPAEKEYFKAHPEEITDHRQWYEITPHDDLTLVSSHGENLFADYIPAENPTHRYAVIAHGWTSIPKNMATPIRHFSERGFNILAPHMRAHGKSQEKVVGMSWPDRFDIIDWITYIVDKDPDAKILLVGVSMGSATVMNVSGEQLPDNVKCIIADCGFTSIWDIFANTLKDRAHLPTRPLMDMMRLVTKAQAGYDIKTAAPLDQVKKSVTPTLFVHGEQDTFIPAAMMYKLYDAAACEKDLLLIPDADHAESWDVHPEIYWPVADKFVDKYIGADD